MITQMAGRESREKNGGNGGGIAFFARAWYDPSWRHRKDDGEALPMPGGHARGKRPIAVWVTESERTEFRRIAELQGTTTAGLLRILVQAVIAGMVALPDPMPTKIGETWRNEEP
jgi:hypothetical protein